MFSNKQNQNLSDVNFNKCQLVSKRIAALFLCISRSKLAYLTNPNHKYYDPDFPKPILVGRSVRFDVADLLAYVALKK
jgi:predicted DNA-binding transcriptional regulator AlpA